MKKISIASWVVTALMWGCTGNGDFVTPEVKPLMEAVYASGFVVSEKEYQAFSQVDGYIIEKLVNDGDPVKAGDPLYIIEADQQNARYRIAKESYDLARQNFREDSPVLSELMAALQSAKTKMRYDSVNFVRYTNLLERNATSKAEYDRIKLLYENSRNDYKLAENRYKKTYDQLRLEFRNAESQYNIARDESARYIIRSQVDGMVFKTFKEKGELIKRTELVAVLGSMGSFYLLLNVDELDVQRIKVGQKALVKIDAYPDQVFNAEISRIYPLVDMRQQSIRVDAKLKDELPAAFSGLALEANIIIRQKEDALVIPKGALLPGDSVLVKRNKGEQKIKVRTGMVTLSEVEVLEGIEPTSLIKVVQ